MNMNLLFYRLLPRFLCLAICMCMTVSAQSYALAAYVDPPPQEQEENTEKAEEEEATPEDEPPSEEEEVLLTLLKVKVYNADLENAPIKDATLVLKHSNGEEFSGKTSSSGVTTFSRLPYGKIKIVVTSSGMKTSRKSIELSQPNQSQIFELAQRGG